MVAPCEAVGEELAPPLCLAGGTSSRGQKGSAPRVLMQSAGKTKVSRQLFRSKRIFKAGSPKSSPQEDGKLIHYVAVRNHIYKKCLMTWKIMMYKYICMLQSA